MIRAPPRFPLPFAAHRSYRAPLAPGYHVSSFRVVDQVIRQRLDADCSDQLHGVRLELRQLQDRNLRRGAHHLTIYRIAVWVL
jgi:CRISPR/Cas system endoribonuclease Cas6 (RAMP superfamily)